MSDPTMADLEALLREAEQFCSYTRSGRALVRGLIGAILDLRALADAQESISNDLRRERDALARDAGELQAELAALSLAAMDADTHCWGPGWSSPEEAEKHVRLLRLLAQPNRDRSNTAWRILDQWREEAKDLGRRESGRKAQAREQRMLEALEKTERGRDGLCPVCGQGVHSWTGPTTSDPRNERGHAPGCLIDACLAATKEDR